MSLGIEGCGYENKGYLYYGCKYLHNNSETIFHYLEYNIILDFDKDTNSPLRCEECKIGKRMIQKIK